jgi:hypothetical protein
MAMDPVAEFMMNHTLSTIRAHSTPAPGGFPKLNEFRSRFCGEGGGTAAFTLQLFPSARQTLTVGCHLFAGQSVSGFPSTRAIPTSCALPMTVKQGVGRLLKIFRENAGGSLIPRFWLNSARWSFGHRATSWVPRSVACTDVNRTTLFGPA